MPKKKSRQPKVHNKTSWSALGAVFLISLATVLLIPMTSLTITGLAISYAKEGTTINMEVRDVLGVKEAFVSIKETIKGGKVLFTQDNSIEFDGKAISKFTISSNDPDKIGNIDIIYKLKTPELQGVSKDNLMLFVNGEKVDLHLTKEKDGFFFYSSEGTSLGSYVLGEKTFEEEPIVETPSVGKAIEEPKEEVIPEPVIEEKGFFARLWEKLFN